MNRRFAPTALISAVLILSCASFFSISAQELNSHPIVLAHPHVNAPVKFDISRPLRDMATEVPLPVGLHEAPPIKYPHQQQLMLAAQRPQAKDEALQTTGGPLVSATLGLNLLGVGNGFPGYTVPDAPPDTNLAVGDTQVVEWVNVSYAVFDKSTGAVIAGPILGNAFWSGFGGACQNTNSGDIIAQWDKVAHRWVMAQNVFSSPYATCVAISTTDDATGTYYRYQFSQPGFPDYPKWGVWPDAYYQSQNNFGSAGETFEGAYVCAYDRNKMLVGDSTAEQVCFQLESFDNSLMPADLDSVNTAPPTGEPEVYLGSIDESSSAVYQYLFHVDFTTPSNSTFTGANGSMPITVASYSLACGGFSACIPQKGISDELDSLGDRLMYRLAYRNFSGDHQTWLVSHSVTAGSSTGMRWYEFRAPETSTSLSVYQQGTFAPDSNYRWMGSLAMDQSQDIALGYSVSSSSMYPSVSYTGRVATDTLGTMESEASIISGSGSQPDTSNRWGDYSSMVIDAADDCTFWYTQEYYTLTQTFDWSTQLASIKFPNCGASSSFSLSASPTALSIAPDNQGTSTITSTISNGYNNSITLSASGAPSGMTVSFNPNIIPAPGSGTSVMTVSVSSGTTTGTYPITVTGSDGTNQQTTTVTVTVTAAGSFTLSASPSSLTVVQGNQGTSTLTTTVVNGFNSSIGLSALGVPSGVTVTFNPSTISAPGSGSSTVTFAVSSSASQGIFPITISGSGGGIQQNTTITLTVAPPPSFSIHAAPPGLTVAQGSQGSVTVNSSITGGFNSSVTLSASGMPAGVTASFSLNPIPTPGSGNSTLTFNVASSVPTGTYTITVTGSGGGMQSTATISLTVAAGPNFTVTASPSSVSIGQGYQGSTTITVAVSGGFNSQVSLSTSGVPSGVNVNLQPNNLNAPGSGNSTMSIQVNNNTPAGTYPITVTGNGGGLQRSTVVTLTVTVPNFTISASPSSLTVGQGSQGTSIITAVVSGGFNNQIQLQANGLPGGVNASFNPSNIPAPGSRRFH